MLSFRDDAKGCQQSEENVQESQDLRGGGTAEHRKMEQERGDGEGGLRRGERRVGRAGGGVSKARIPGKAVLRATVQPASPLLSIWKRAEGIILI